MRGQHTEFSSEVRDFTTRMQYKSNLFNSQRCWVKLQVVELSEIKPGNSHTPNENASHFEQPYAIGFWLLHQNLWSWVVNFKIVMSEQKKS